MQLSNGSVIEDIVGEELEEYKSHFFAGPHAVSRIKPQGYRLRGTYKFFAQQYLDFKVGIAQ